MNRYSQGLVSAGSPGLHCRTVYALFPHDLQEGWTRNIRRSGGITIRPEPDDQTQYWVRVSVAYRSIIRLSAPLRLIRSTAAAMLALRKVMLGMWEQMLAICGSSQTAFKRACSTVKPRVVNRSVRATPVRSSVPRSMNAAHADRAWVFMAVSPIPAFAQAETASFGREGAGCRKNR